MDIAFLTAPREPAYLYQSLSSMLLADASASALTVRLLVDAEDASFVQHLSHHRRAIVTVSSPEDRSLPLGQRVTRAFIRALRESTSGEGLLVAEDDIKFSDNWLTRLNEAIAHAKRRSGERFILSAYSPHRFTAEPISKYPYGWYFGNQLVCVPSTVRAELASYLERHISQKNGDLLLGTWVAQASVPTWATVPSLVQHIGRKSGVGSSWHESPIWSPRV